MNAVKANMRKSHRTLLRIEEIREDAIDVVIPGWNPHRVVRLPKSLFPEPFRPHLKKGEHLFAQVNIGAEEASELYFKDFEVAPNLDDNDSLP